MRPEHLCHISNYSSPAVTSPLGADYCHCGAVRLSWLRLCSQWTSALSREFKHTHLAAYVFSHSAALELLPPRPLSSCAGTSRCTSISPLSARRLENSTRLTFVSPPRCDSQRSQTKEHVAFQCETHCGSRAKSDPTLQRIKGQHRQNRVRHFSAADSLQALSVIHEPIKDHSYWLMAAIFCTPELMRSEASLCPQAVWPPNTGMFRY